MAKEQCYHCGDMDESENIVDSTHNDVSIRAHQKCVDENPADDEVDELQPDE